MIKTLRLVADVGEAWEGAVTWSSEGVCRSELEQWSWDGSEWQILEAQWKISELGMHCIYKQTTGL